MAQVASRVSKGYIAILLLAALIAIGAGWTAIASGMDGEAYDWMFRGQALPSSPASSVIIAFDSPTLQAYGGMRQLRGTLARVLERMKPANPGVVAIDIVLPDAGDLDQDNALELALRGMPRVILPANRIPSDETWQLPLARFAAHAAAVGHVHAADHRVSRVLPLEVAVARKRLWAVALEAFRVGKGDGQIVETPGSLSVGGREIPATRETSRALYLKYRDGIPTIPAKQILENAEVAQRPRGKAVFIGITDLTAAHDRLMTPLGRTMAGVEIHAQAYETLVNGDFLKPAGNLALIGVCLLFAAAAGLTFALLDGWAAYVVAGAVVLTAHATPHLAFSQGIILPYLAPIWAAWLSSGAAAAWQYFVVRKRLHKSESDRARYQQAIHFVTHEMRSPLTAIQGSSELMGRYNLNEDKRKQIAEMINSESRRLARMIQTFLDIERLTDGQMEICTESFRADEVLNACMDRARPLADRKQIDLRRGTTDPVFLKGDRELMEYAVYNLLTNAIKYSPEETTVTVDIRREGQTMQLSVRDQGIGMDERELKRIFQKFYRTKRAESSGEAGTGIGLSIVEQIVQHHGGRMNVTSSPGKGSCFTMVVPAAPASQFIPQQT